MNTKKKQQGFFLIEVVVSVLIISLILIFVLGSVFDTVRVTQRSLERTQAAFLLEETIEVLRFERNQSWTTIASLDLNEAYSIVWNGTRWQIQEGASLVGGFERSFACASVQRDAQGDIVQSSGTLDSGTRLCTVSILWNTNSGPRTETASFYISNTTL